MTETNGIDRLDRIERILSQTSNLAVQNTEAIALNREQLQEYIAFSSQERQKFREDLASLEQLVRQNTILIAQQKERVDQFIAAGEQQRQQMDEAIIELRELRMEIRGLQTENRRILDHLFGEETNNE
ncbi:MAG: hypothetical protein QNJ54_34450 [Prochloraceae cyanobacterium]|nr:hypothetical protein [Prochloraceae cyanobacterium]